MAKHWRGVGIGLLGCLSILGTALLALRHSATSGKPADPTPEHRQDTAAGLTRHRPQDPAPARISPAAEQLLPDHKRNPSPSELLNFDREGFERAWHHVLTTFTPESERNLFLRQVAIRMAMLGHPEEALSAIYAALGEGQTRAEMVEACFAYAKSPQSLRRLYEALDSDGDRAAARRAVASCIARDMAQGNTSPVGAYDLSFLGADAPAFLKEAAVQYFAQVTNDGSLEKARALNAILGMGFDNNSLKAILTRLSNTAPFEVWEVLSTHAGKADSESHGRIAEAMVAVDPLRAVAEVIRLGAPADLEAALAAWGRMDSSKPIAWLEANDARLSPAMRDGANSGIARVLSQTGKFNQAWATVTTISDPGTKTKVEGQIWQTERTAVRNQARENPAATVDAIASGQSQHADYWIEEAMGQWIARDSEAAAAWYEQTGSSLSPNKRQYVAAAYARESLRQGDSELARRWAAMITDEKARRRIEDDIAKAQPAPP